MESILALQQPVLTTLEIIKPLLLVHRLSTDWKPLTSQPSQQVPGHRPQAREAEQSRRAADAAAAAAAAASMASLQAGEAQAQLSAGAAEGMFQVTGHQLHGKGGQSKSVHTRPHNVWVVRRWMVSLDMWSSDKTGKGQRLRPLSLCGRLSGGRQAAQVVVEAGKLPHDRRTEWNALCASSVQV